MKSYKVIYKKRAEKLNLILWIKKFHCDNDYTFRLRIGSNRAIFEVYKDKIVILVLNIGSRGDIYK